MLLTYGEQLRMVARWRGGGGGRGFEESEREKRRERKMRSRRRRSRSRRRRRRRRGIVMVPERTKLEMRYIYRPVYKRKVHGNLFLALNISLLKSDTFTFSMRCTERRFPYNS